MKQLYAFVLALTLAFSSSIAAISPAYAATPFLSVSQSGNSLTLAVTSADPNSSVQLSYTNPGTTLATNISNSYWYTNYNGSFTTSIDPNSYGIANGAYLFVTVNGQQSQQYQYSPGYTGTNYAGNLQLSQTNVNLSTGQSATVLAYNVSSQLYVSGNTNPSVASATAASNVVSIYAANAGNTTLTICSNYTNTQCASVYVTVGGYSGSSNITFSNNNVNLSIGQSQTVSIYSTSSYYSNNYYISSNTNPSIVTGSVSGNSLSLYGQSNGSSTLTVCQSNTNTCGTLYVTVAGNYSGSGNIWFSPSNPTLYAGQSLAVSINSSSTPYAYNSTYYSNAYYVSSNTSPQVVSASISGTVLNLYGNQNGSSSVTVCHSSLNYCGTVYVTVGNSNTSYNTLTFSTQNPSLTVGQNTTISVYNNGNYYGNNLYISSNTNPSIATASVSSQTLTLYGNAAGSTSVTVCQSGNSVCGTLFVTVSGNNNYNGYMQYANGQLVNQNGTIYLIYKNTGTGFANMASFLGLGYSFSNVASATNGYIQSTGYVINTSNAAHPWGSWIKMGQTVYFVHESGLIPIPDWNTFLNNGGQAPFIVNSNSWDWQRPTLSIMTYSDSRLR